MCLFFATKKCLLNLLYFSIFNFFIKTYFIVAMVAGQISPKPNRPQSKCIQKEWSRLKLTLFYKLKNFSIWVVFLGLVYLDALFLLKGHFIDNRKNHQRIFPILSGTTSSPVDINPKSSWYTELSINWSQDHQHLIYNQPL